jgi:outer membrane lipoprotein SlyB
MTIVKRGMEPGTTLGRTLAGLILLCGCTPNYSPDTYASGSVQQANKVEQGVVAGRRQVGVSAQGTAGAVTGAAAGGIAGAQMPGGGVRTALTALGGSVVGGLVGSGIERATGDTTAYEYIVRKAGGELVSVTQKDTLPLELGQKVLVIAGGQARIVPDYTVPPPAVALVEPVFSTPLAAPAVPGLLPAPLEKESGGQPIDPR